MLNLLLSANAKKKNEKKKCVGINDTKTKRSDFIANNEVSENVNFVLMASNVWDDYVDCCHKVDFKFVYFVE